MMPRLLKRKEIASRSNVECITSNSIWSFKDNSCNMCMVPTNPRPPPPPTTPRVDRIHICAYHHWGPEVSIRADATPRDVIGGLLFAIFGPGIANATRASVVVGTVCVLSVAAFSLYPPHQLVHMRSDVNESRPSISSA